MGFFYRENKINWVKEKPKPKVLLLKDFKPLCLTHDVLFPDSMKVRILPKYHGHDFVVQTEWITQEGQDDNFAKTKILSQLDEIGTNHKGLQEYFRRCKNRWPTGYKLKYKSNAGFMCAERFMELYEVETNAYGKKKNVARGKIQPVTALNALSLAKRYKFIAKVEAIVWSEPDFSSDSDDELPTVLTKRTMYYGYTLALLKLMTER